MGREQKLNEIIDNEFLNRETSMTLIGGNRKAKKMRTKLVDQNADWLVRKLGSPESRPFYCKCVLNLPWARIVELVEIALRPQIIKHAAYFVRLARNEMDNLGIR